MRFAFALCLGGILFAQMSKVTAGGDGDPSTGRGKAGQCRICHGLNGYAKIPVAPHIGGEPTGYLSSQLKAFRSGERTNEMMSVIAKNLSDQDIADLAAWYASQKVEAELPASSSADAAPSPCVSCHGANGLATVENVPNLAGESIIYIETQLKAFRSGKRTNAIMSGIADQLSNDEMRIFAKWYSAIELNIKPVN